MRVGVYLSINLSDMKCVAVKSQIRQALINNKVNACPMAMRVAWHSSGTYDANNGTGGSGRV